MKIYAEGYKLALEDVLKDIESMSQGSYEMPYFEALDAVKAEVTESLKSCLKTLEAL